MDDATSFERAIDFTLKWEVGGKPKPKERPASGASKPPQTPPQAAGDAPPCPKCGGKMHERTNKADGNKFWGCCSYPDCRGTVNIEDAAGAGEAPEYPEGFGPDIPLPEKYGHGGELLGEVDNDYLERMMDKGKGVCVKVASAELARRREMGIVIAEPQADDGADDAEFDENLPF